MVDMEKSRQILTSGLKLDCWNPGDPQNYVWRQCITRLSVAVYGILVFEIFPSLYGCPIYYFAVYLSISIVFSVWADADVLYQSRPGDIGARLVAGQS